MSEVKRKNFTGVQKAKVVVEAIKGLKTVNQIAQEYGVHPTQVSRKRSINPRLSNQIQLRHAHDFDTETE
jgi:transposase-like protein